MNTIWKFPLEITDKQTIEIPMNARFLCAKSQDNQPVLYFIVDTKAKLVPTDIEIYGTGHPIENELDHYLGTVLTHNESLVWHIFASCLVRR